MGTIVYSTSTEGHAAKVAEQRRRQQHARLAEQIAYAPTRRGPAHRSVYGMCTGCGSVEVRLDEATGTRDLSHMGESATYPTGYGCEACS